VNAKRIGENFFHWSGWDLQTDKPSRNMLEMMGGMDDVVQDLYAWALGQAPIWFRRVGAWPTCRRTGPGPSRCH
jgi:hypothetical protein